ncbi:Alpha/Beta hydrolase protein [Collybia nuda]|uniref:Alpha/Beta hydrolase protein n=1 Tax=Collybia nuda TaxID=64659 RepID=A0A9P5XVN6_9AGAR|nr:Alpha/Beta hydrolase protein [Collybia nuda]
MTSKQTSLTIAGLEVNIYSSSASDDEKPVVIFFLLHGRLESTEVADPIARAMIEQAQTIRRERELLVITFDQRNHGKRLTNPIANHAWDLNDRNTHNDRHAVDMYAIQTGTANDVSFLIDFLPAYLFPNKERPIVEWGIAGKSLGGHSTWISLKQDMRIKTGISIIGCPDYIKLLKYRAQEAGVPTLPPYIPSSFRAFVERVDPVAAPYSSSSEENPFLDKRILVLSGRDDKLVPWSASEAFVEGLYVGEKGVKRVKVYAGIGHECTDEMVTEMMNFIAEFCL